VWHFGAFDPRLVVALFFSNIVLVYHNITPWYFFSKGRPLVAIKSLLGKWQLGFLPKKLRYVGVSPFNSLELENMKKSTVMTVACHVRKIESISRKKSRIPSFFFNGRIAENKNVANLFEIIDSVSASFEQRLIFLFNGSGDLVGNDKKKLDAAISRVRMNPKVRLVWIKNGLSEQSLDRIYQFSWVYVSTSLHEGFGLPVFEAIRNRTPALYKECGGTEAILNNLGCIDAGSDLDFTTTLSGLVKDPQKRRELLANQTKEMETFFEQATLQRILRKY
jgi:glycosyltransferase involved in cell wall biosynthesis